MSLLKELSRREFLRGAASAIAIGGSAFTVGGFLSGCSESEISTADSQFNAKNRSVVIVGAGLAGLTAAYELARTGWNVRVVEATERLGGKVLTLTDGWNDDQYVDAGAEYVGENDLSMRKYIADFGLRVQAPLPDAADLAPGVFYGSKLATRTGFESAGNGVVGKDLARYYEAIDELAGTIKNPARPEKAPDADRLDSQSLESFLEDLKLDPRAKFLIANNVAYSAVGPQNISLLAAVQAAAYFTTVKPVRGATAAPIQGGNSQLVNAFASRIGQDKFRLSSPVDYIVDDGTRVEVGFQGGTVQADTAVIAVPLPALDAIDIQPGVPDPVARAARDIRYGPCVSTQVQYPGRVWRAGGYSGLVSIDEPIGYTWDSTLNEAGTSGIITFFSTGEGANELTVNGDSDATINSCQTEFARIFPNVSSNPSGKATSFNWTTNQYSPGLNAAWAPGQVTSFWSALRQPIGRLHLAGEYAGTKYASMEGAVQSGTTAAKAINRKYRT